MNVPIRKTNCIMNPLEQKIVNNFSWNKWSSKTKYGY